MEFEHPVICPMNGLAIGAKLDTYSITSCRIALHGRVLVQLNDPNYKSNYLSKLLVCKSKTRRGQLERIVNPRMCIVHGLFKRETNWEIFVGLRAYLIIKSHEDSSDHIHRIYVQELDEKTVILLGGWLLTNQSTQLSITELRV
ncbi:unnamed protein product [Schistosoma mattheei]|uniref:Uncharacterized protein n=1 Tax=Schistosoma mattheei TaxID=31246 RepID=A0A3P8G1E9_9TREM|nr:unnamed protein product [Schistosoma mattheei]